MLFTMKLSYMCFMFKVVTKRLKEMMAAEIQQFRNAKGIQGLL